MSFAKSAVIVIPIRKVGNFEKQENGEREREQATSSYNVTFFLLHLLLHDVCQDKWNLY